MRERALRVNEVLLAFWSARNIDLVDFKLEFGRAGGAVLLADEITPDGSRLWERGTGRHMDKDVFRRDLGDLSATYRDTLNDFRDETIAIASSRMEKNGDVTVMTLVKGSASDTKVDYRLRKSDAGWRGIDVIIEGVSLVQNFRSQAQEIVSTEGPDGLIKKLRAKQLKSPTAKKA